MQEFPCKKRKTVSWADDCMKPLVEERKYTPENNSLRLVSFNNFQNVADTILSAKFNEDSRKNLLAAFNISVDGIISNICLHEKGWSFEVKCSGYITNVFYNCSVWPLSADKFRLKTEHVATVPTTGFFYSLVLAMAGLTATNTFKI
jgi:hypothetical protein